MPRVYLAFSLPDEQEEYELAYNGAKYKDALDDLAKWLREQLKYNSELKPVEKRCYIACRDKVIEVMGEL
jgi:hypothetical protein